MLKALNPNYSAKSPPMKSHVSGKSKTIYVLPPSQQPLQSCRMLFAAAEEGGRGDAAVSQL